MKHKDRTYKLHFRGNVGRRFRADNPGYDKYDKSRGGRKGLVPVREGFFNARR